MGIASLNPSYARILFVGWAASAHQAMANATNVFRAAMVGTGCPPYENLRSLFAQC